MGYRSTFLKVTSSPKNSLWCIWTSSVSPVVRNSIPGPIAISISG